MNGSARRLSCCLALATATYSKLVSVKELWHKDRVIQLLAWQFQLDRALDLE